MKVLAPDNRKPVEVKLRLDAATYDQIQLYREYRAEAGDHFANDSQVIIGVVSAYFEVGDPTFNRWRKSNPLKAVPIAPVKVEKKAKKVNGVDPHPFTIPEQQGSGSSEK